MNGKKRRLNSIPLNDVMNVPARDDIKILFCPDCETRFSGWDKVAIRGGLILCPNCAVELKPILHGVRPLVHIMDEFATKEGGPYDA